MNIKEIKIKNFKSLYDVSFCPGNINVFIGANGSGKSSVVLDGLNLADDRIRLFAINKNKHGYAELNRVQICQELLETGQSLSRLWINGLLGGVPELL